MPPSSQALRVHGMVPLALVLALMASAAAARAAEPAPSGAITEGEGHVAIGLGARLGVGQMAVSFRDVGVWGRVAPLELSAGLALTRDLALHAALYDAHMLAPVSDYAHVVSFDLYGFGPGISYRLPELGVVLSGSLLVTRLHAAFHSYEPPLDVTTPWGLTGRIGVGRDFPITPHWRLGFAGEALVGRMGKDGDPTNATDSAYTARSLALLVSASYLQPLGLGTWPGGAEPPAVEETHRPHEGFHLGASIGLAWLRVRSSDVPEISGAGSSVALSAGHGLGHDLVLVGELYEVHVDEPAFPNDKLADLEMHGFGPGLRWYGVPAGAFVSATTLISRLSFHNTIPGDGRYAIRAITSWSLVGRVSVGKEWRVSARWGLGFAAELLYARMSEQAAPGAEPRPLNVAGAALALSASFD